MQKPEVLSQAIYSWSCLWAQRQLFRIRAGDCTASVIEHRQDREGKFAFTIIKLACRKGTMTKRYYFGLFLTQSVSGLLI